jgi:hypothetical protein
MSALYSSLPGLTHARPVEVGVSSKCSFIVMAGLVPAIHVFTCPTNVADDPAKPGHDNQNRVPV